jgi:hypothetical protein
MQVGLAARVRQLADREWGPLWNQGTLTLVTRRVLRLMNIPGTAIPVLEVWTS